MLSDERSYVSDVCAEPEKVSSLFADFSVVEL